MKLILKIKPYNPSKKNRIIIWIKKKSALDDDIKQLLQIFKENIKISKLTIFLRFYIVSSTNPAIILNIISAIEESIPDVYFKDEKSITIEDYVDI